MRHRLGLATRTQISVCKLPFPSAGTAVSLFRAKTVDAMTSLINTDADWPDVSQGSLYMSIIQCINDEQMVDHTLIVL